MRLGADDGIERSSRETQVDRVHQYRADTRVSGLGLFELMFREVDGGHGGVVGCSDQVCRSTAVSAGDIEYYLRLMGNRFTQSVDEGGARLRRIKCVVCPVTVIRDAAVSLCCARERGLERRVVFDGDEDFSVSHDRPS